MGQQLKKQEIKISDYQKAYIIGKYDKANSDYSFFRTPALEAAWNAGYNGHDIDFNDIVECFRAGNIPESGISYNYRENESEYGLSVLNVLGEEEIGSAIWFANRETIKIKGIRLPYRGSDGETLILPLNIEQYDF